MYGTNRTKAAQALASNYEGADELVNYEGDDQLVGYTGAQDDGLDFCGDPTGNFANEGAKRVGIGFNITNASASTALIALNAAYFSSTAELNAATGLTFTGIVTDGTIATSITGTAKNSKHKIAPWLRWVNKNPQRVTEVIIEVNDSQALSEELNWVRMSPYRQLESGSFKLSEYIPDQFNQKRAVIPMEKLGGLQFDDQTLIYLNIGGTNLVASTGVIMDIYLRFGATVNPAATLAKKATRAYRTFAMAIGRNKR